MKKSILWKKQKVNIINIRNYNMPKPTDPKKYQYMFSDDMKFLQKIIILHPKFADKFLALKRSSYHTFRPNQWDLPGGNVLFGENHLDSLLREIHEETGLQVKNIIPLDVITRMEKDFYFLIISYKGEALSEAVTISDEHTDSKWVTKNEFNNLEIDQVFKDFIQKYA